MKKVYTCDMYIHIYLHLKKEKLSFQEINYFPRNEKDLMGIKSKFCGEIVFTTTLFAFPNTDSLD